MPDFAIDRWNSSPWSRTHINATFGYGDNVDIDVPGIVEVLSSEHYFSAAEIGATICTLHFMFSKTVKRIDRPLLEQGIIGVIVCHREPRRVERLTPKHGVSFEVAIGPVDITVQESNATGTEQIFRAPLNSISALKLETLLPDVPARAGLDRAVTTALPTTLLTSA